MEDSAEEKSDEGGRIFTDVHGGDRRVVDMAEQEEMTAKRVKRWKIEKEGGCLHWTIPIAGVGVEARCIPPCAIEY